MPLVVGLVLTSVEKAECADRPFALANPLKIRQHRLVSEARGITPGELEVLRAWLDHDVVGARALRSQLSTETRVFSSCDCGCASIGFVHEDDDSEPGASIFDVDAEIVNESGESVGGMALFVKAGHLHDVDIHSWHDELPFPTVDQIRWHVRRVDE